MSNQDEKNMKSEEIEVNCEEEHDHEACDHDHDHDHHHTVTLELEDGTELICPVIAIFEADKNEYIALLHPIEETALLYRFFDYEAKYTPGATKEICPAPLPQEQTKKAQSCAKTAHKALKCKVWSRTDMIIQEGEIFMLETNTIPGMTETSLVPLAAKAAGLSLSQLLDKLIELSLELANSR